MLTLKYFLNIIDCLSDYSLTIINKQFSIIKNNFLEQNKTASWRFEKNQNDHNFNNFKTRHYDSETNMFVNLHF